MSAVPKRIDVREFLNHDIEKVNEGLKSSKVVVYEDGTETLLKPQSIKINRYVWELFKGTDIKITSEFNIENYFTSEYYAKGSYDAMLTAFQKKLIYDSKVDENELMTILEEKRKIMVATVNHIYSKFLPSISRFNGGVDIEDLLDIQLTPELMASFDVVKEQLSTESIVENHKILDEILRRRENDNNPIAIGYRSKTNNPNQVKQILGAIGHRADLNNKIFPIPIASSFTLGLGSLYDMAIESRTAGKALNMAGKAIQTTEYLARELEILTMPVEKIIYEDCGSTSYENWYIKPEIAGVQKCGLSNIEGKYYLDTDGVEKSIMGNETHLIGTTIKLRTVEGCKLNNRKHVCSKCFGKLAFSIPKHSNLGHICVTTLMKLISQSVLSTKHLVSSAVTKPIVLDNIQSKYFKVYKENNISVLKKWMGVQKRSLKIKIPYKQCFGIKELDNANINEIDIAFISMIDTMYLEATDNGRVEDYIPINVRQGNRYGIFDIEFLKYIKEVGFDIDESEMVTIDLSRWNSVKPIITLPKLEFSFQAFAEDIKKTVRSKKYMYENNIETPAVLKSKLFDLINSKLDINLAVIEIIVYALTVRDLDKHDYRLGRHSDVPRVIDMKTAIGNRSFGGAAAWEDLLKIIFSPFSFIDQRESSPLDVFLFPDKFI